MASVIFSSLPVFILEIFILASYFQETGKHLTEVIWTQRELNPCAQ